MKVGTLSVTMKEPEKQEASKTSEDLHDRKERINPLRTTQDQQNEIKHLNKASSS